jgi:hypothetical protein
MAQTGRFEVATSVDDLDASEVNPGRVVHLPSGNLWCGTCGGAIALVNGKGSGYDG